MQYQSEYAERPSATSTPSSPTLPTAPAPVETTSGDVVMTPVDWVISGHADYAPSETPIAHYVIGSPDGYYIDRDASSGIGALYEASANGPTVDPGASLSVLAEGLENNSEDEVDLFVMCLHCGFVDIWTSGLPRVAGVDGECDAVIGVVG